MENLYRIPFTFVQCPNLKLKKPSWIRKPSNTTWVRSTMRSSIVSRRFLAFSLVYSFLIFSSLPAWSMILSSNHPVLVSRLDGGDEWHRAHCHLFSGSTTDEFGHQKPVAFMAWRINGQYIMEGLAASFMFTLGGLGFILLDQTNKPNMPRLNRILMILCSFIFILVAYCATKIFIRFVPSALTWERRNESVSLF